MLIFKFHNFFFYNSRVKWYFCDWYLYYDINRKSVIFQLSLTQFFFVFRQTIRSGNCDNLVTSATTAQSSFVVAIVVSLFIFVIFIMVVVLWCVRAGRCPHGGQGGLYIGGGGHYHHHHHHGYHYNTGSSGGSGGGGGGFSSFGTGDGGGGGGGGFWSAAIFIFIILYV